MFRKVHKKIFAKFTRKRQALFFNKVAGLTLSLQLYYKMTLPQLFSRGFCKIFKGIYFHRTPRMAASVIKNKTLYSDITYFFLTQQLRHNPYIIELFRLEFLV